MNELIEPRPQSPQGKEAGNMFWGVGWVWLGKVWIGYVWLG